MVACGNHSAWTAIVQDRDVAPPPTNELLKNQGAEDLIRAMTIESTAPTNEAMSSITLASALLLPGRMTPGVRSGAGRSYLAARRTANGSASEGGGGGTTFSESGRGLGRGFQAKNPKKLVISMLERGRYDGFHTRGAV